MKFKMMFVFGLASVVTLTGCTRSSNVEVPEITNVAGNITESSIAEGTVTSLTETVESLSLPESITESVESVESVTESVESVTESVESITESVESITESVVEAVENPPVHNSVLPEITPSLLGDKLDTSVIFDKFPEVIACSSYGFDYTKDGVYDYIVNLSTPDMIVYKVIDGVSFEYVPEVIYTSPYLDNCSMELVNFGTTADGTPVITFVNRVSSLYYDAETKTIDCYATDTLGNEYTFKAQSSGASQVSFEGDVETGYFERLFVADKLSDEFKYLGCDGRVPFTYSPAFDKFNDLSMSVTTYRLFGKNAVSEEEYQQFKPN